MSIPAGRPSAFWTFPQCPRRDQTPPNRREMPICTAEPAFPPPSRGFISLGPQQGGRHAETSLSQRHHQKKPNFCTNMQRKIKWSCPYWQPPAAPIQAWGLAPKGAGDSHTQERHFRFKTQITDPKEKCPLVPLAVDFTTHNHWRPVPSPSVSVSLRVVTSAVLSPPRTPP